MSKYTVEPYLYNGKYNVISNETAEVVASFDTYMEAEQYVEENK